MWWLFVILFFIVLILCNTHRISDLKMKVKCIRAVSGQLNWTTYYFKEINGCHIHFVPIERQEHKTSLDGKCWCRTSKDQYNINTVVYRHERLGYRMHDIAS